MSHSLPSLLSTIRIVLVNTTLPANIGSAARAMHTMGLSNLIVVDPKYPIDNTSVSHSAGGFSILQNTLVVNSLQEAVSDCHLIFAASSRTRSLPRPVVNPTQAANLITNFVDNVSTQDATNLIYPCSNQAKPKHTPAKIAVLFGREDRGLTNEELALADYHIQIDANPNYPVLNVAAAVQVIASFFYAHFLTHTTTPASQYIEANQHPQLNVISRQIWDENPATYEQTQKLQTQLIHLMHTLNLIETDNPAELRELPSRLARLSSRLQLDQKECEILTAVVAKLERRIS